MSPTEVKWTILQNRNFEKIGSKVLALLKNQREVSAKERHLLKSSNSCFLSINYSLGRGVNMEGFNFKMAMVLQ